MFTAGGSFDKELFAANKNTIELAKMILREDLLGKDQEG